MDVVNSSCTSKYIFNRQSIAENIAIGVPKNRINFKDVKDAAKEQFMNL